MILSAAIELFGTLQVALHISDDTLASQIAESSPGGTKSSYTASYG